MPDGRASLPTLMWPDSGRARIALLRGNQDAAARWLVAFHGEPDVPVKIFFLEYPEITACQ